MNYNPKFNDFYNYRRGKYILLKETPEIYQKYIQPYIPRNDFDKWNNKNKIIYEDNLFKIIKDIKWRNDDVVDMHVLFVVKEEKLHSLRDLRRKDINMLKHIKNFGMKFIKNKYDLEEEEIACYIHYYPTIWQLHIHFSNVNKRDMRDDEIKIGLGNYVEDVITNLEIDDQYYKNATLNLHICNKIFTKHFIKSKI